jgi:serine/threonine protein kinase
MELVKGVPITEYCDQAQLSTRERLELFVPVCQAIQHAHQKGVIHRDVKPTNILVTLFDDKPVPKVIDFGVAKATAQRLTERTLFTEFGAVVGTLEYMSPEQAAMAGQDVDTRSDVYSLGVLLYELLTGTTPLERAKLRSAAYAQCPLDNQNNRLSKGFRRLWWVAMGTISRRISHRGQFFPQFLRGQLEELPEAQVGQLQAQQAVRRLTLTAAGPEST